MRLVLRSIACTFAILTACAGEPVGREFAAEQDLLRAVGDCVVVGSFDVHYPAKVVGVELGQPALRFEHASTPHLYPPMDGYELRAVFVEHEGRRGVLVLRSNQES